ncbi:hypothetical protein APC22_14650 [Acinetobacter pittii]|nr:hypothetical protein APC22_14650 [Acinetobacter pittii]
MKRSLILLLSTFISIQAFAEENACEKIWDSFKNKNESIKIDKVNVPCKQIWEDNNKAKLVKTIGLNPKDGEFKHEVRQFQKPYDNQQAEQISLMV